MSFPGHPDAIDDARIPITKVVDLDDWTITVDLTKTRILQKITTVIGDDPTVRALLWQIINNRADGETVTNLLNWLTENTALRDALTLTLAPSTAEGLAVNLHAMAHVPYRCTAEDDHTEDGRCPYWADHLSDLCAEHHAQLDDNATVNVEEAS